MMLSCYQSIKDKNLESNSQQRAISASARAAVISLSKIKISKAIHNKKIVYQRFRNAVISLSKIKISKKLLIFVLKITLL